MADQWETITSTEAFNGVFGVADIVISYHDENDMVLRRPLIVAEGFDPGHITNPEADEGEETFRSFIASVEFSNSTDLQNLISDDPSNYDIVYVNWRNGTDWLERNELVLEEVIRWVNANKQPLGGVMQPNVVLGSSMGGVIARMALGRMDRGDGSFNGNGGYAAHETNLFINFDGPQQGANVPLGYQAGDRHATRLYVGTGGLAVTAEVVMLILRQGSPLQTLLLPDQPAARELLINRLDINYNLENSIHEQFLDDLNSTWLYPTNIRNIAIANGSECAIDQEFSAGSTLLHYQRSVTSRFLGDMALLFNGAFLSASNISQFIAQPLLIPGSSKFSLELDVHALANGGGNEVYEAEISYTKKVLWLFPATVVLAYKSYNAPSGLLPFDTYPGGFYPVSLDNPGSASQDWMFNYDASFFMQRRFCFTPTASVLDIGEGNFTLTNTDYMRQYIGGIPPGSPINSPFDNFITAFHVDPITVTFEDFEVITSGDEPHITFFIRNGNWLANELDGNIGVSCIGDCVNFSISGDDIFCTTSGNYSIPNLPAGATVTWSVSPGSIVTINSPTSQQTTLTSIGNGIITLTATIANACSGGEIVINKQNITVGAPVIEFVSFTNAVEGEGYWCSTHSGNLFSVEPSSLEGPFEARLLNYPSMTVFRTNSTASPGVDPFGYVPYGWYIFQLRATNTCGTSEWFETEIEYVDCYEYGRGCYDCSSTVIVSPNPTKGTMLLELVDITGTNVKNGQLKTIQKIKIINKMGQVKKQITGNSLNKMTINIADLPNDIYMIQVFDGKTWVGKQVIKY